MNHRVQPYLLAKADIKPLANESWHVTAVLLTTKTRKNIMNAKEATNAKNIYEPSVPVIVSNVRLSQSGKHTILSAFLEGDESQHRISYQVHLAASAFDTLKVKARGAKITNAIFEPALDENGEVIAPEKSAYKDKDGANRNGVLVHVYLQDGEISMTESKAAFGTNAFLAACGETIVDEPEEELAF